MSARFFDSFVIWAMVVVVMMIRARIDTAIKCTLCNRVLHLCVPETNDKDVPKELNLQPCILCYFLLFWVEWDWIHLFRWPLFDLLHQLRMLDDDKCWAVVGIIGRGSRSTRIKPFTVLLCPLQISHGLNLARTRTGAVGSRRLTAWAIARHYGHTFRNLLSASGDVSFWRQGPKKKEGHIWIKDKMKSIS
jgi:hypothetical protein